MAKPIFLDQLQEFHVKDASRLTPGTRVLFGHVPSLQSKSIPESKIYPYGEIATVNYIQEASYNDLMKKNFTEEWATKRDNLVFFTYDRLEAMDHRYLTDCGVEIYRPGQLWNDTNFTVILEDLEKSGLELAMAVSPAYAERLDLYNKSVIEPDRSGVRY